MDNNRIYEYAFSCMYNHVKNTKEKIQDAHETSLSMEQQVLLLSDGGGDLFGRIARFSRHGLIVQTQELIMRLFKANNISYIPLKGADVFMPFERVENGKHIAYIFSTSMTERIDNWDELRKKYNLDGIKVVALVDIQGDKELNNKISSYESSMTKGFVTYVPVKKIFELLGEKEYSIYMDYCRRFNADVRELIGYSTVKIPSKAMMYSFKENLIQEIINFDYLATVSEIDKTQLEIIKHNYFDRKLYRVVLGDSNFADSLISSEWYYSIFSTSNGIEQTATIAGYLKSIEQLLFKIIMLSAGEGKTIKRKYVSDGSKNKYIKLTTTNIDKVDTTLGSLISFIKYHYGNDVWNVNKACMKFVVKKLNEYKDKCRNDHFHKDNIYAFEEIKEIREQTIVLYFLLLGSLRIENKNLADFDLFIEKHKTLDYITYDKIEKWLTGILGGDTLLDSKVPIYLFLKRYSGNIWHMDFCTISGFDDKLIPLNVEYPYIFDALEWEAKPDELEPENLLELVDLYLEKGEYSQKLKEHVFIAIGKFAEHDIIYKNIGYKNTHNHK